MDQSNRAKQNLEKVIGDVDNKISHTSGLETKTVLDTIISEQNIKYY